MTTFQLTMMFINAFCCGAAAARCFDNVLDGRPIKGALALAGLNLFAVLLVVVTP